MEKKHLDRRIGQMRREGTVFRKADVGGTLTADQLRDRYDAVVLAMGATEARDLPVPGRELGGVHQAMEFLPQANRVAPGEAATSDGSDQIVATGKHVVIIGGVTPAPTASARPRAREPRASRSLEIMPEPSSTRPSNQPWPSYPMTFRVSSAHEEAGERVYAVSTQEFLGDESGNVRSGAWSTWSSRVASSPRSRAPSARSRRSWCCSRWASPVPRRPG